MNVQSIIESANTLAGNMARSSRRGSRGPRPRWPRQILSLIAGTPAHAAELPDEQDEDKPLAVMTAMSRSRRGRGRGPRPISFPRNRRR